MHGYIAFDIETTGLNPESDQILSIAAIADNAPKLEIKELPYFYWSINNGPIIHGHPTALAMNANLLKLIGKGGVPNNKNVSTSTGHASIDHVFRQFDHWLNSHFGEKGQITYAGKNLASFDFQFIDEAKYLNLLRPHHRILDVGSLFYNQSDYDIGKMPSLMTCLFRAGFAEPEVTHDALEDCYAIVHCIRWKLNNAAQHQRNP